MAPSDGGGMAASLRQAWSQSKTFRIVLSLALGYTFLRSAVQAAFLSGLIVPGEYKTAGGMYVPPDLQVYLDAAGRLVAREDLYPSGPLPQVEFYQYSPVFAMFFVPFRWLPTGALLLVHSLLHILAYAALYFRWVRLFRRFSVGRAAEAMAWLLPVWLVYSSFWADWAYLNIYVVAALLSTFLLEAVLEERLGLASLWLALLLAVKPHWAFAALVPLLLGQTRFFFRLALWGAAGYTALALATMLAAGPGYGWRQHVAYAQFLLHLGANFPWRGPEAGFPGYNHSVLQTLVFWAGASPGVMHLATALKILATAPLAWVGVRHVLQPAGRPAREAPELGLDLAFALYLAAFLWLDWVWELSLGPVLFAYLAGTTDRRGGVWLAAIFLPLALLDLWQLISVAAFGSRVIAGAYILTDPGIYLPITLIVILAFYAVLVKRLWQAPAAYAPAVQPST